MPANPTMDLRCDASTSYDGWWVSEIRPRARDFGAQGHLTSATYASIYEEAVGQFVCHAWATADPSYVVADLSVTYVREVTPADLPLRVYVDVIDVGRSSFTIQVVMHSAGRHVCSTSIRRYAAWDRAARAARPMTEQERVSLLHR